MESGLIEKMVKFRVDNPHYFLVSPLVINNSLATYLLEVEGKIRLDDYYNSYASHPVLWQSGIFAQELHEWFLDKYLKTGRWEELHLGKKEMAMSRFSINSVLWFGDEMKKFEGMVPGDDEEFLSCIYPTSQGLSNAWNGDAIVAHFAFFTQREELDRMGILEKYGRFCLDSWAKDKTMKDISDKVQIIMHNVEARHVQLENLPSPYKRVTPRKIPHARIKKLVPDIVLEFLRMRRLHKKTTGFIIK